MTDPLYRDPRLDPPPLREDEIRSRRFDDLTSSNAMWGWIAGAVVVVLVLLFVFTSSGPNNPSSTAGTTPPPPASTTGQGPARSMTPPAISGTLRQAPAPSGQNDPR